MKLNYLSVVDTFFPDRPAGSARVAWDVAQMVRDMGCSVTVFCQRQSGETETVGEHEGVRVVRYVLPKVHSLDPLKIPKRISAGVSAAKAFLGNQSWDVVHVHSPVEGNIIHKALGDGPRYLGTVHSPAVLEQEINWGAQGWKGTVKRLFGMGQLRKLEGGFLKKTHTIQTLSSFTKAVIHEQYGVGEKISVIPHWCRTDFKREYTKLAARAELAWPEHSKIIFTLRRLVPRMGIDFAIRSAAPLLRERKDVQYMIAGSGYLESSLKQLAESLGVGGQVHFLGRVSEDQLKRCYEAADLFLLPTNSLECFGLIILEALAYGLPVMSTDVAAIPEVMRPILPDFMVSAGAEEALKEKLSRWASGGLVPPTADQLLEYAFRNYSRETVHPMLMKFLGLPD